MAGNRPRDAQRSKVYAAESRFITAHPEVRLTRLSDMSNFLIDWQNDRWVTRQLRDNTQILGTKATRMASDISDGDLVRLSAGSRNYCMIGETRTGNTKYRLSIPSYDFSTLRVIHAWAHLFSPHDASWHGIEFVKAYLSLVNHELGATLRQDLKKEFTTGRVRTRTVSDETRAKHRENYQQRQVARLPEMGENLVRMYQELQEGK